MANPTESCFVQVGWARSSNRLPRRVLSAWKLFRRACAASTIDGMSLYDPLLSRSRPAWGFAHLGHRIRPCYKVQLTKDHAIAGRDSMRRYGCGLRAEILG